MRIAKLLLPALVMLLTGLFPPVALAADEDFEVGYEFSPDVVGSLGGEVQLVVTVRNTGPTNITWVDVAINTQTPFSARWTGTITPGASRRVAFRVTFSRYDINTRKVLQVSMNNNSSSNPDGVETIPFELRGTGRNYTIAGGVSPARTTYNVGETITISYAITNVMEASTLMHMTTRAMITSGPRVIYLGPSVDLGNVFPGATKTTSFRYTFDRDDPGDVYVTCMQEYTLLGVTYGVGQPIAHFTVAAPRPEINFSAALSADLTEVESGGTVRLRVSLRNTGADAIDRFSVTAEDGGLEASTEGLPAGGSGSVTLSTPVFATTTFRFVVVGATGDDSNSVLTNAVTVFARGAETSTSVDMTTGSPAEPTTSALPETSTSLGPAPSTDAGASPPTGQDSTAGTTDVDAAAQRTDGLSTTMLVVIIAVAAVVAIVTVATACVAVAKIRGSRTSGTGRDR